MTMVSFKDPPVFLMRFLFCTCNTPVVKVGGASFVMQDSWQVIVSALKPCNGLLKKYPNLTKTQSEIMPVWPI